MKPREVLRPLAVVGSSIVAALGASGCGGISPEERHAQVVEHVNRYNAIYSKTSPVGKFVLSYGAKLEVRDKESPYLNSVFGSGCLDGTAYDVDGGQISAKFIASGLLFSSAARVDAKIPTALATAKIHEKDKNTLIISAGKENIPDLVFDGLTELRNQQFPTIKMGAVNRSVPFLTAANEETRNVLDSYGCSDSGYRGTY